MDCPKCRHKNPKGAKFCNTCGNDLTRSGKSTRHVVALDQKLLKIQRYLPKGLTEKILSEKEKIEGERKQVTVMFCDMEGFTPLVERLGPERAYSLMDRIYEILIRNVHNYEGTVNEFTGDGIMALFGAPITVENAPQWALRSALSIHREMNTLSKEQKLPLKMRVGINTGPVVLGSLGNDLRVEFKAVGDTVNLASRMEGLSEPGCTYVTEKTYNLTEGLFCFEDIGTQRVKGKTLSVSVYKLLSAKKDVYRPRLGAERMIFSEMVGRESELDKLELQVMKTINGQGSIVNIIGEAGIGKSRLVAELKKREVIKRVTLLEGRAISIGRNLPFHPIIDILKQWARIMENDGELKAFAKLEVAVRNICVDDFHEVLPFVATLMGMKFSGRHAERIKGIEGEALEKLILKNVRSLLIKAAESAPLVLVMEDLHWADTSSIELLLSFFRLVLTHKILFINVFRPCYEETGDRIVKASKEMFCEHTIEIFLNPLTERMSETLIHNMLKMKGLRHPVINLIVKRSDGNPFFIEEVVRSLIDEGAIVVKDCTFSVTEKIDTAIVPYTINDVLMARIDRLEGRTRDLIKVASVIGRNFFHRILAEVAKRIEEIDQRLGYLKEAQLIQERNRMEEVEYLFKHALAQESAYASILPLKRQKLHEKVAESIETVFKERIHEFYGMLAFHYSKAKNEEKAEHYLIKAGEESLRSSASSEALHYYREALNLYLKKYGDTADPEKLSMLERNIAITLSNKGKYVEAVEYYDSALSHMRVKTPKHWLSSLWLALLSFSRVLLSLYLPFQGFKRIPTEREKKIIDLRYKKGKALAVSNPKRLFFESINLLANLSSFQLIKIEKGFGMFAESAVLFQWLGISFKLSSRILDRCKEKITSNDTENRLYYEISLLMHNFLKGDWSSINEYDTNLVAGGLEIGESFEVSVYVVWHGLLNIERGCFDDAQEMIEKLKEIYEEFEQDFAKILYYQLNSRFLLKTRRIQAATVLLNRGIQFVKKAETGIYMNDLYTMRVQVKMISGDIHGAEDALLSATNYLMEVKPIPYFYTPFLLAQSKVEIRRMKERLETGFETNLSEYRKRAFESSKIALKKASKSAYHITEALKIMGTYYWLVDKRKKALKLWRRSIAEGERMGALVELSRSYFEVGSYLSEPDSKFKELDGMNANEYFKKARRMFEEMDLQWDLDELDKVSSYTLTIYNTK